MENTKIEWATHTFNPYEGCQKVSAGCTNCYAETRANRYKSSRWGAEASGGTRVVRGLSVEPLLGEIVFRHTWHPGGRPATAHGADALRIMRDQGAGIDWVIVGGESGPRSRGCNLAAIRSIVEQCRGAGVPVFVKQLGANPFDPTRGAAVPGATTARSLPIVEEDVTTLAAVLDAMSFKLDDPKGGDMYEWPDDLRVRQFPTPTLGA